MISLPISTLDRNSLAKCPPCRADGGNSFSALVRVGHRENGRQEIGHPEAARAGHGVGRSGAETSGSLAVALVWRGSSLPNTQIAVFRRTGVEGPGPRTGPMRRDTSRSRRGRQAYCPYNLHLRPAPAAIRAAWERYLASPTFGVTPALNATRTDAKREGSGHSGIEAKP